MKEKNIFMHARPTGPRAPDLDTSALLIAERLIGEILSWDLVDWSAVELYKGKKFFFGRTRTGGASIHDQLKPLFDRCDPGGTDFSALKPSPVVNANLSRLVGCLCRHVGRHGLAVDEAVGPALQRTAEQEQLHLTVMRRLLDRIETHPDLGERAGRLKQIAAAAESELEKHFADLINERLESSFLTDGGLDPYKVKGLRDQARSRVQETDAVNRRELIGLAMPDLALDEEALIRIEMTKILLSRFPYVRNYELMLLAELAMLQRPLTPRLARERRLADKVGDIDAALIEHLDRAMAGIAAQVSPTRQPPLKDRTVAICGSGALPMTALFLHLLTGADIVLIDDDQAAVDCSRRLIANLERTEILTPGVLSVIDENAGNVHFHASGSSSESSQGVPLGCDAVMIASLVDHDAKASIAARFSSDGSAPSLLIMRSATGLSAKLVYDPVPTETFSRGHLAYCGEALPATQIATHLDRPEAARQGVACMASPDILAVAHPDVINTTEVYRQFPTARAAIDFDFDACRAVDDWAHALEQAAAKLGST